MSLRMHKDSVILTDSNFRWHGYMQQQGLRCDRDEYPPIAFWQGQDIHSQYVRMVPGAQNRAAGAALFGLNVCNYEVRKGVSYAPVVTRNPRLDQVVRGPGRETSIYTAEVTTTLATLSIRFNAYPNQPDFGLTANPCWPSTLVDDPGFALLISDPWYSAHSNAQRRQTARLYSNPPPLAFTQNNPPRAGYQKRIPGPLDVNLISGGVGGTPPNGPSVPRVNNAEPTAADPFSAPTGASTAATVGGGGLSALAIMKPTGRSNE